MNNGVVFLALVGLGLAALVLYVLCRMAGEQDRLARHAEHAMCPHSDVTITRFKNV